MGQLENQIGFFFEEKEFGEDYDDQLLKTLNVYLRSEGTILPFDQSLHKNMHSLLQTLHDYSHKRIIDALEKLNVEYSNEQHLDAFRKRIDRM